MLTVSPQWRILLNHFHVFYDLLTHLLIKTIKLNKYERARSRSTHSVFLTGYELNLCQKNCHSVAESCPLSTISAKICFSYVWQKCSTQCDWIMNRHVIVCVAMTRQYSDYEVRQLIVVWKQKCEIEKTKLLTKWVQTLQALRVVVVYKR